MTTIKHSLDSIDSQTEDFRASLTRPAMLPMLAMGVLLLGFCVLIGLLTWSASRSEQAEQVTGQLHAIGNRLVDMETGLRGFELHGDERFLEPFEDGRAALDADLQTLQALIIDPVQLQAAKDLEGRAGLWVLWADEMLRRTADGDEQDLDASLEGKRQMDGIRSLLREMLSFESHTHEQREARRDSIIWLAIVVSLAGTLGLGLWLARRWRKALRHTAATYTNVLRLTRQQQRQLRDAHASLDKEIQAVGVIQQSLLPRTVPQISNLSVAAHYQTSARAGGDYYDFFALPTATPASDEQAWGILIADVSGHGTPAAVVMAVTHTIAHGYEHPGEPPSHLMDFVNRRLCDGYTGRDVAFVTAFYAVYHPASRRLEYSNAGHNPPRLLRAGTTTFEELRAARGLPLGIDDSDSHRCEKMQLDRGDLLILYTDGITEARDPAGEFFDTDRLDTAAARDGTAQERVGFIMDAVRRHGATPGPPADDQTVIVLVVE